VPALYTTTWDVTPSISDIDLAPLGRRLTIGLNRSFLLYPDTTYNCTMDQRLFDEYADQLRKTRYLFTLEGRPWGIPIAMLGANGWNIDLTQGIYSGYTVSYFSLQLAIYMGFVEVVYLGLDLQHSEGKTHFFGADFHSRDHEQTEFPKMTRMMEQGAARAEAMGVKVYNCSPVSNLRGFRRISFEDAIAL
jgi:hypothetical protein